ncbi:lipoate-protein ligase A [Geomicrobium sp. JCM 19037]|uniref:lipoate--protein ligase n=1 Tax=Geomicrobium sp. JCM 19037 TaxID=1460634 RepID=UPI00045F278A|nr:lipoate--protein ligase [Geomicrobium sp. JCM 19037]GAK03840.1 lipoate-protein ligase A [Geomicrobium sp. JCM 19037]
MIFVDNANTTDPRINLAIEEYILTHFDEHDVYLLFYINEPSIIIGKNQNTIEEINRDYVNDHNLHVVRRLSGGGAVYHDLGNLNFSFITNDDGNSFSNFKKFTEPVVEALQQMGVPAELSGRNDLHADGRKISGNAQFATKGRMFSHGTLMLDSEIENVVSALNVSDEKIRSKGIKSIRSRVANINEFIEEPLSMEEFKERLLQSIFAGDANFSRYTLTDEDWEKIKQISEERYQKWEWNYGKSPSYDIKRSKKFQAGLVDFRFKVKKGVISEMNIFGDFFGTGEIEEAETHFVGTRYKEEDIRVAVEQLDTKKYFGAIDREDLITLITS